MLSKEAATFKNKYEKWISISNENSKIHVEDLEKEIIHKDNIIDQLLLDLPKISTQNTHHPKAEVISGPLRAIEYNNKPDAEPSTTETRGTIPKKKGHIDHQIKEVCKHIIKSLCTLKPQFQKKELIPTTSVTEIDTTVWSPSHPSPIITSNAKFQILTWSRNTTLITSD